MKMQRILLPDEITRQRIDLLQEGHVRVPGIHFGGGADTCAFLEDLLVWLAKKNALPYPLTALIAVNTLWDLRRLLF